MASGWSANLTLQMSLAKIHQRSQAAVIRPGWPEKSSLQPIQLSLFG